MAKLCIAMTLLLGLLGGCVAMPSSEAADAPSPRRCRDRTFDVYFATGDARLTPAAVNAIRAQAARAKRCAIQTVTIVGNGDSASETQQTSLDLAARRAATVGERLVSFGVPPGLIAQDAIAVEGAAPGRPRRPLRGRTQVRIDFQ